VAYVYILEDTKNGKFYIGSTNNIEYRFRQHKNKKHHSSKCLTDPKIVFKQEFGNLKIARKIELRLKRYKRKDFIERIVRDGIIKKTSGL
jgi:predicted GIY-YIG superfamily endonuclease